MKRVQGRMIEKKKLPTDADYFFDGLVADWLMQDRINKARAQVDEAIRRVEGIMGQL